VARKNQSKKFRGNSGVKKGWGALVILVLIILSGGYFAISTYQEEKSRDAQRIMSKKPLSVERHRMPDKGKIIAPLQESYTAAIIPYVPREKPKMRSSLRTSGSVAIVIDDMGTNLQELDALTSLQIVMTFSVIPQLPHATNVAEKAYERGYEVMVHLPMEPKGYPQRHLEQNGLLMSLTDAEIDRQVRRYLELVPHAAGANNHMGSRFTEDSAKMLPVMQLLRERQLYFLDSKTTPLSVGYSLAHEVGLKAGSRNVFLDNVQEVGAIRLQLQQAAQIARKRGYAIAICHPHKATIEALSQVLPELKADGITFVKVSQVMR
jgi:uncharacterized protein